MSPRIRTLSKRLSYDPRGDARSPKGFSVPEARSSVGWLHWGDWFFLAFAWRVGRWWGSCAERVALRVLRCSAGKEMRGWVSPRVGLGAELLCECSRRLCLAQVVAECTAVPVQPADSQPPAAYGASEGYSSTGKCPPMSRNKCCLVTRVLKLHWIALLSVDSSIVVICITALLKTGPLYAHASHPTPKSRLPPCGDLAPSAPPKKVACQCSEATKY